MKKLMVIFSAMLLIALGACSTSNEADTKKESSKTNENKTVAVTKQDNTIATTNGLEITLDSSKVTNATDKNGKSNKKVYSFEVTGTNISNSEVGMGSIEFALKTSDGKKVDPDYAYDSFGDTIENGKSLKGKLYFTVDSNVTASELQYIPGEKVLASWDVKEK
ncbi:DUF4352 domain-containing protein [Listeria fleischmannii]|uniref:DUF4352 domain-containing protein n=1 Tax=Listeria fleischmannii TaxID=1069827 RepID=A0A841YHA5_9LIST|nr:DUF4352 domain-containing protein [Listeria fleischmannii]EIA19709.1 hypothetical protein KKC_10936 [Listeria fleischmannii subsp. coloradonensis]MBC1399882.1 DUF4352 domain-containing protein [Listeria fleischmannii]MBC1419440.1 DUF4352 domain-containing protein [Listeria fleischmannii]MBC1428191.1 DUF4352 domain-containing protein [Listeria fleischmannii]STY34554.1 Telomeric repeat-binding factor 2 [Listeria fleischmannii subsp. coloradonensis]